MRVLDAINNLSLTASTSWGQIIDFMFDKNRVLSKINKTTTCWEWTGHIRKRDGYGIFAITQYKKKYAHRIVYELVKGQIPKNLVLDHLCRNKKCVNPAHLEPVSNRENILRGNIHNKKIQCPKGHEYKGKNLIITKWGRQCRICNNNNDAKRYMNFKKYGIRRMNLNGNTTPPAV